MPGNIYVSSGGTKLFAAIGVTYPAGSTLTCTSGTTTLKAKTTSGMWTFAVPNTGTWTVTATSGTQTASRSVSITAEGQNRTVTLQYRTYIFQSGTGIVVSPLVVSSRPDRSDLTSTLTNSSLPHTGSYNYFTVTTSNINLSNYSVGGFVWTASTVDLSAFSKLYVEMTVGSAYSSAYSVTIGVGSSLPSSQTNLGNWTANKTGITTSSKATHTVDISSVNTSLYVKICGYAIAYTIHNIYLE